MPLSWNEIRHRAIQFAHNWSGAQSEAAEKQTFRLNLGQSFSASSPSVA